MKEIRAKRGEQNYVFSIKNNYLNMKNNGRTMLVRGPAGRFRSRGGRGTGPDA